MLAWRLQMGSTRAGASRPRHLGKSLLLRFWRRWPCPLPATVLLQVTRQPLRLPSGPAPAFSLQRDVPPLRPGPVTQKVAPVSWCHTSGTCESDP